MCFAIPYKVIKVNKNNVLIEGGQTVRLGKELSVQKGDYLRVIGKIAVEVLRREDGLKIRQLIKRLN